jgi:hypothetical protein
VVGPLELGQVPAEPPVTACDAAPTRPDYHESFAFERLQRAACGLSADAVLAALIRRGKTEGSCRTISLDPFTVAALRQHVEALGADEAESRPPGHKAGHTGNKNGPPDEFRRAVLPGSGGRI